MRLADHAPMHCSSCFQQKPQERHVDLEVSYDGPYVPGATPYSIDDNIICETCLGLAGRLVGLGDVEAQTAQVEALTAQLAKSRELDSVRLDAVAALQEAVAAVEAMPGEPAPDPRVAELEATLAGATEAAEAQKSVLESALEQERAEVEKLRSELEVAAPAPAPEPEPTPAAAEPPAEPVEDAPAEPAKPAKPRKSAATKGA